ncbi:MAG: glycosyltransferase family 4 protein [Chitinophagaceae bacterium]|nr:glycosyltransferase family 4 protein [Chitinophagaceae bacterium]
MNILFVCNEFPPGRTGGIGSATRQLAEALVAKGHGVLIAGLYQPGYGHADYEEAGGIKIWRKRFSIDNAFFKSDFIFSRGLRFLFGRSGIMRRSTERGLRSFLAFLNELVETHQVDIIEWPDFNEWFQYTGCGSVAYQFKVPVVVKLHGTDSYISHQLGRRVNPRVFERERLHLSGASALTAVSDHTAQHNTAFYGLEQKVEVLYNSVWVKPALPAIKKNRLIVFAGTLSPAKGAGSLMLAWNRVHQTHPDAVLHVFGKGEPARFARMLDRNSRASVVFKGFIPGDQLSGIYQTATAAVFPSYTECFSMAPLEAMSFGCPVIYTSRSSGKELIRDGFDGLLVDPDDIEGIAAAIRKLIDNEPLRETISANARDTVAKRFNVTDSAEKHLTFYNRLIQKFQTADD